MQWYHTVLAFFFVVIAVLVVIVILLQRGRGVGLAGAFGGAGGGSAFGAKTGDVLTWVTITGAVVLLTFTVILNYVFVPQTAGLPKLPTPPPPPPLPITTVPASAPAAVPARPPASAPATAPAAPESGPGAWRWDETLPRPELAGTMIFGADEA
jgi:preprotein translocase subunit SecG